MSAVLEYDKLANLYAKNNFLYEDDSWGFFINFVQTFWLVFVFGGYMFVLTLLEYYA